MQRPALNITSSPCSDGSDLTECSSGDDDDAPLAASATRGLRGFNLVLGAPSPRTVYSLAEPLSSPSNCLLYASLLTLNTIGKLHDKTLDFGPE